MEYSFDTIDDFYDAYNNLRDDIKKAFNVTPNVRIDGAISLLQRTKGSQHFVCVTHKRAEMIKQIKLYEDKGSEYKLVIRKGVAIPNK